MQCTHEWPFSAHRTPRRSLNTGGYAIFKPIVLTSCSTARTLCNDVIKWKHFPRYWPFVRGIHRSPVNSPHKGKWRGALVFSLICVWINDWVNNREAGDFSRYCAHYDVTLMGQPAQWPIFTKQLGDLQGNFALNVGQEILIQISQSLWYLMSFIATLPPCVIDRSPHNVALCFYIIRLSVR